MEKKKGRLASISKTKGRGNIKVGEWEVLKDAVEEKIPKR